MGVGGFEIEDSVLSRQVGSARKMGARRQVSYFPTFLVPLPQFLGNPFGMLDDIERILFQEQTILRRIESLAGEITEAYRGKEFVVIAVLNGSLIFAADLMRRIPLPLRLDCLSVASYHGGVESSGFVTFDQLTLPDVKGRHVLIVDDILDSGRTLHAIGERLRAEAMPASIRICVLLRKEKQRAESLEVDFVGFDIGDEFVVGYGLDYAERYRNLPFVGVLRTEIFSGQPPE
jgi:hypoxanthine phosphoribosyltransferase